jgi:hypothetical protein
MDVPIIDQVRIQAQVLVPLVKALQAELGEDAAHALVRQALGGLYRSYGERWWRAQGGDLGRVMGGAFERFAADGALQYEVVEQSAEAYAINVTDCRYARFYNEIGAPELGFLLTCMPDFDVAEGLGPDVQLTRTQTIMQGASHCDFRYRRG